MESENKNNSPVIIAIVVIVAAILGWFLWSKQSIAPAPPSANDVVDANKVLESVSNVSNPAADVGNKIPETNPFQQTNTNPFSGYKNPFGN